MATRKKTARKTGSKTGRKTTKRKSAAKRTVIEPTQGDKRYVRRNRRGQFKEMDDMGRSLSQDRRRKSKTKAKKGQGDRGDR